MKKNKKSKIVLITTTLALLFATATIGKITYTEAAYSKNQVNIENESEKVDVIVVFKNKSAASKEKSELLDNDVYIKDEFKNIPGYAVSLSPKEIAELQNNPDVAMIEKDIVVSINADVKDWGISTVKVEESWDSNYTGKGVKVAVLDTGIDTEHKDLNVKGGTSFVSYTNSYDDDQGHGTHVGGIIGAKKNGFGTVGAAPDVDLYAVKVLDNKGDGLLSDVISGVDWSITNKMDIVNLSLDSKTGSSALESIINKAYANDVLVVAAAGNTGTEDGKNDTVNYPGQYKNAITVAATDVNNIRASFSSTGKAVDVSAPGVDILSTYLDNQYAYMSGTSMATPYVAATLALYKEANPTLSNNELRNLLESNVIDLGDVGKDTWYGLGLVQAPIALPLPIEKTLVESFETDTEINLNKTSYKLKDRVYITTEVKDKNDNLLSNADISFEIRQANGEVLTYEATTNDEGVINLTLATNENSSIGTYKINVSTVKENYTNSESNTTFKLTK